MAGQLKIYTTNEYSVEFPIEEEAYKIDFGILNGIEGEEKVITLFCKNVGDQPLIDRKIQETDDGEAFQSYSIDGENYEESALELDDLLPGETEEIFVKVTIPPGTSNVGNPRTISFSIEGNSI